MIHLEKTRLPLHHAVCQLKIPPPSLTYIVFSQQLVEELKIVLCCEIVGHAYCAGCLKHRKRAGLGN